MNELIDKIQQICRVCLLEHSLMFSVLHTSCMNQNISTMLMTCTTVKIELDDKLPQLVCSNCLDRLETAYLFKQECERSEDTLRRLLSENGEKLDNKFTNFDSKELSNSSNDTSEKQPETYNECDSINASTMVKVEMRVDENEVIELKSEQTDKEEESDDTGIKLRRRVTRKSTATFMKIKKQNKRILPVFKCIACDKEFRHHKRYWLHTKEHPNFTCYICWKRFDSVESLDDHAEEHPNQLYVCDQEDCDLQYNNCRSFVLHKKNDHEIQNYIQCSDCEKTFDCHEKWDIHIQKHLRTRRYQCEVCLKQFSQKTSLETHMKIHDESFKCDQCERMYTSTVKLERHKRSHETSFICEECGRKYNQKYNLKKHIDIAHKGMKNPRRIKSHLCPHCGQTFARPVDLTTHIRTHTGSKPFSCNKCEYRCHDKQLLKSHLRIHSGERPYKCDFCGKSFRSRSYLTVHKRFHTGYRPYICSQCTKGFTNSKDLKVHERTHTGIKLYHCNVCNNSFTTLHYLKVHAKKHDAQ